MSHTPGPWEARVTKYYGRPDHMQEVVVGTSEESICILTGSRGCIEQAMPDARLIAAAPDLLETLEFIRDNLEFYHATSTDIESEGYEKLASAIRKARVQQ